MMRLPSLPHYDAAALQALAAQGQAIHATFSARGYVRVEPSILQPADVFLDRSGEDIRRRMFVFADPGGAELCLRPDLTIPACRMWLERNPGGEGQARLWYDGPAFRYQAHDIGRAAQFFQSGVELIGATDREAAEAEVLGLTFGAVRAAGLKRLTIKHGDLALFSALLDALDLPDEVRTRLKRHFWRPGYFRDLLARLTEGAEQSGASANGTERAALLVELGLMGEARARAVIADVLSLADISEVGGRTVAEIAERFLEQAREASASRLPRETADLIAAFLAVSGPTTDAIAEIRQIAARVGDGLAKPLARLEDRLERIARESIDLSRAHFATEFGRNMEYYTGFVFEIWSCDAEGDVQIAGGGRYDTLLQHLGAPREVPAVGAAIRTERLLAARREEGRT